MTNLVKSFDQHKAQMEKDVDLIHTRIETTANEMRSALCAACRENDVNRDKVLGNISARLDLIDQRHARLDGAKGVKGSIGGAILLLLAGVAGSVATIITAAIQAIKS